MTIKELREQTQMTQKAFSEYFGIPVRTIQDWEGGRRKPPEYVVKLIEYKLIKEGLIMTREEFIKQKVSEGWEDCCEMEYGCGSRRWYLKKGKYGVTYNLYGNYKSQSPLELNTTFKAIMDYENKDENAMKIVNEYVNSEDLCFKSQSQYATDLRLIAQALIIEKNNIAEL